MNLSPTRIGIIENSIRLLWENANICLTDYPTVVPLSTLMDSFHTNISLVEEATLTLDVVTKFLKKAERMMEVEGGNITLAGFLYAEPVDAFLFVNADDPIARRRFSAAHELGHLILHWDSNEPVFRDGLRFRFTPEEEARRNVEAKESLTIGESYQHGSISSQSLDLMEQEANVFAARLLMPAVSCRSLWETHSERFAERPTLLARRLASDLLVSPLAMKIRLTELGLIP